MEKCKRSSELNNSDSNYFDSYSNLNIHEEMLRDESRMKGYMKAILDNKHLFKNKIILDVGSGTGILTMLALKAGAKFVHAVENSDIVKLSHKLIKHNNLQDKILLHTCKAEDLDLKGEKVDIIISEWMGYALFFENMLPTVLHCRDNFLRKNGIIFPTKAHIYIAMIEDSEYKHDKLAFWDNICGFDFSIVKPIVLQEPIVDLVEPNSLISESHQIIEFDLRTIKPTDLDFTSQFTLQTNKTNFFQGFVLWFDVVFSGHVEYILSTSPFDNPSHWKQTVLYTNEDLPIYENEKIDLEISFCRNKINKRNLDITLAWKYKDCIQNQIFYLK